MITIKNKIELERFDTFYGKVVRETISGALIDIGNGIVGLAYSSLKVGDKCMCSVRKIKDNGFIILNIDSVSYAA